MISPKSGKTLQYAEIKPCIEQKKSGSKLGLCPLLAYIDSRHVASELENDYFPICLV